MREEYVHFPGSHVVENVHGSSYGDEDEDGGENARENRFLIEENGQSRRGSEEQAVSSSAVGEVNSAGREQGKIDDDGDGGPVGGGDELDTFNELTGSDDGDLERVLGEEEVLVDFGKSVERTEVGEKHGGDEERNDNDHSDSGNGLSSMRLCS